MKNGREINERNRNVMNYNANFIPLLYMPVVPHGCETWSLTIREEHRVLRTILNRSGKM
jgi:hypothetical protein